MPYKPNIVQGDLVATNEEVGILFESDNVEISEKVDGANCAMTIYDGEVLIRNRNHILKKGYLKDTPAKKQFRPAWGWFYENKEKFEKLKGYSVYGEWMWVVHGLKYDKLPSWFMAYELYDQENQKYLDPFVAAKMFDYAGFCTVPVLHRGKITDWSQLEKLANSPTQFTTNALREGICIKIGDGRFLTHRFKLVREGFVQGGLWNEKELTKNKLEKSETSTVPKELS